MEPVLTPFSLMQIYDKDPLMQEETEGPGRIMGMPCHQALGQAACRALPYRNARLFIPIFADPGERHPRGSLFIHDEDGVQHFYYAGKPSRTPVELTAYEFTQAGPFLTMIDRRGHWARIALPPDMGGAGWIDVAKIPTRQSATPMDLTGLRVSAEPGMPVIGSRMVVIVAVKDGHVILRDAQDADDPLSSSIVPLKQPFITTTRPLSDFYDASCRLRIHDESNGC